MPAPEIVDQPVLVEARFRAGGRLQPDAFMWQGQIRRIVDHGREWDEVSEGLAWHCYLVQTAQNETFELRLDEVGARWVLARAWLNEGGTRAI
jgi:hypothetical protein